MSLSNGNVICWRLQSLTNITPNKLYTFVANFNPEIMGDENIFNSTLVRIPIDLSLSALSSSTSSPGLVSITSTIYTTLYNSYISGSFANFSSTTLNALSCLPVSYVGIRTVSTSKNISIIINSKSLDINATSRTIKPGSYTYLYTSSVVNNKYTYAAINNLYSYLFKLSIPGPFTI
jgi:hypothetical protein